MKAIIIEQVGNGWMVTNRDLVHSASYAPGDIHVYRSLKELRADLPNLLTPDSRVPCPTPDEIVRAREKTTESEPFEMPKPTGIKIDKIEHF